MLFGPNGRVVVANVATPGVVEVRATVAITVPLLRKSTLPEAVDGVTVAVRVTLVPWVTEAAEGETATVLAVRVASQAVARLFMSTEPRPVTKLYPVVASEVAESEPMIPVPGQANCPVPTVQ